MYNHFGALWCFCSFFIALQLQSPFTCIVYKNSNYLCSMGGRKREANVLHSTCIQSGLFIFLPFSMNVCLRLFTRKRWTFRSKAAFIFLRIGLERVTQTESRVHPSSGVRGGHQLLWQWGFAHICFQLCPWSPSLYLTPSSLALTQHDPSVIGTSARTTRTTPMTMSRWRYDSSPPARRASARSVWNVLKSAHLKVLLSFISICIFLQGQKHDHRQGDERK